MIAYNTSLAKKNCLSHSFCQLKKCQNMINLWCHVYEVKSTNLVLCIGHDFSQHTKKEGKKHDLLYKLKITFTFYRKEMSDSFKITVISLVFFRRAPVTK